MKWKKNPNNHLKFVGHLSPYNIIIQVGQVLGKGFLNVLGHVALSISGLSMQSHHLHDNMVAQIGHRSLPVASTTLEVISSKPLGFSVIYNGQKDQFCFITWMIITPVAMVVRNCAGADLAQ